MSRPGAAPLVYDVLRLPDDYTDGRVEWLCGCGGAPCARYAPYAELSNPAWVVYVAAPWRTCPAGVPPGRCPVNAAANHPCASP